MNRAMKKMTTTNNMPLKTPQEIVDELAAILTKDRVPTTEEKTSAFLLVANWIAEVQSELMRQKGHYDLLHNIAKYKERLLKAETDEEWDKIVAEM